MTFLWEACLRANMPGSRPDSGCPRLFQTTKSGAHDPVLTDAAAINYINGSPNNHVFKDINVEFSRRHGRAHDPNSFSYSDGSAKKVNGSPKGNRSEQGRQVPEAAGTFTGTGLIMAHSQDELRIDPHGKNTTNTISQLSWWEFRPGSSKSAKRNLLLQRPSSCLQTVK